jgi:S1-C subfamily serine protease
VRNATVNERVRAVCAAAVGTRGWLSEAAFGDALARLKPGQRVRVTVVRQNAERTLTVTLGELPVEQ